MHVPRRQSTDDPADPPGPAHPRATSLQPPHSAVKLVVPLTHHDETPPPAAVDPQCGAPLPSLAHAFRRRHLHAPHPRLGSLVNPHATPSSARRQPTTRSPSRSFVPGGIESRCSGGPALLGDWSGASLRASRGHEPAVAQPTTPREQHQGLPFRGDGVGIGESSYDAGEASSPSRGCV